MAADADTAGLDSYDAAAEMTRSSPPTPFAQRLLERLTDLQERYVHIVERSIVDNVDPNRFNSGVVFIGAARWGWRKDDDLVQDRTRLLADFEEWLSLFRLLHRDAIPETQKRIDRSVSLLRRWLARSKSDTSVPRSTTEARSAVEAAFDELRALVAQVCGQPGELLVVPDTNVLVRDPDVTKFLDVLGTPAYCVVVVPLVLAELDELKDRGRTPELRDKAQAAVRRLKGIRDRSNGDLRAGAVVAGSIRLRAEHRDVAVDEILEWLSPDSPDDRLLAAALDLQARHPGAAVVLITGDINLQNKASVAGMPYRDPSG